MSRKDVAPEYRRVLGITDGSETDAYRGSRTTEPVRGYVTAAGERTLAGSNLENPIEEFERSSTHRDGGGDRAASILESAPPDESEDTTSEPPHGSSDR